LIRVIEIAPEANGCVHRVEVSRGHDLEIRDATFAVVRTTINRVAGVRRQRVERDGHHARRTTHTGHRAELCNEVAVETCRLGSSKRARRGIGRRRHQHSLGREAEIDTTQMDERSQQQAGRHQQYER
jgi:hypothetical protein